jgi:acyl-CoA dehydrogenase
MAKLFASEIAFQVADRAVQIHGGAGVLDNSPIGAMFRDLRLFRIGEGASEIQRMLIARSVLGRGRT